MGDEQNEIFKKQEKKLKRTLDGQNNFHANE